MRHTHGRRGDSGRLAYGSGTARVADRMPVHALEGIGSTPEAAILAMTGTVCPGSYYVTVLAPAQDRSSGRTLPPTVVGEIVPRANTRRVQLGTERGVTQGLPNR